jgi:A/G-specific adenine glycosylase
LRIFFFLIFSIFPILMLHEKFFTTSLIAWNRNENTRQMPWKGEKDPYKIWISEIILQQTRVQQGLAYYNRFIKTFPNVKSLATAPEQKVFKLWEGLGYYSRCRNLIASAKFIHDKLEDKFPEDYVQILSLKGIGNYTASAIASFAFNKPYAVLDGNVFRVLSRFFGIEIPINTTTGKKYYSELAQMLLDKKNPAEYNQAIMDFGAVICKPSVPLCLECPFQKKCVAFLKDKVSLLPVNEKIIKQKERFFNYLIVEHKQKIYVKERTQKDIWQNLYEFILIETESLLDEMDFLNSDPFLSIFESNDFKVKTISKIYSQKLTHQLIRGRFFYIELKKPLKNPGQLSLVPEKQLNRLPVPKFIATYLTEKKMYL